MTTIAYRNGVLAADSACGRGGTHMGAVSKIIRRDDGAMAAIVGTAALQGPFFKWFVAGEDGERPTVPDPDNNNVATALVFRPDGSCEVYECGGWYTLDPTPYYAVGSGRDVALGAMFAGADPEVAVRAAIVHDSGTGGDVTVLRHDPAPIRPRPALGLVSKEAAAAHA